MAGSGKLGPPSSIDLSEGGPPPPHVPVTMQPVVKCVYHVLKEIRSIKAVDAYTIDDFRTVLEAAFDDKKTRNTIITDLMLSQFRPDETTYSILIRHDEDSTLQGRILTEKMARSLHEQCHISPAFDSVLPQPTARQDWRRVDLAK
jgi:hypothetical protein